MWTQLAAILIAGCTDTPPPLQVSGLVIAPPIPGSAMSAGYFTLTNNSDAPITITDVDSPHYDAVDMHETVIANDIARMLPLDAVTLSPGDVVTFERGGKHLMLSRRNDTAGPVMLYFYSGDTVLLTVSAGAR
ncbi:MAG: copper chaperone PCu(A)C [Woeseiaceae bacterium]|nr:copper chaperone PCu(A)C [Woeseiaceae bacterium]